MSDAEKLECALMALEIIEGTSRRDPKEWYTRWMPGYLQVPPSTREGYIHR